MGNSSEDTTPPDDLSESLIQRLDALDLPKLKAVRSYVDRRIEAVRRPIEDEIEASAAGDVIEIENHGTYAIVRKHPPNPDDNGADTTLVSLYHVRREPQLDGTESLHWAYLGDIRDSEQTRCLSCGGTLEDDASVCPHCGSEQITRSETEE